MISPWDLLTITEELGQGDLVSAETPATPNDDRIPNCTRLFALVVCIYRLLVAKCHGGRPDYIKRLHDNNLRWILEIFKCSGQYLEDAEEKFGEWIKDRSYLSLIAALDMFLYRFRRHEMAILTAGAHVSRYNHCTVLDDIARLCRATELGTTELLEWVFVERAADELYMIHRKGQELYVAHFYAPHLSDLGLSRRSPYSATANPLIHYWCNATAALMGSSQGEKSRITYHGDLSGATISAMVLAYAEWEHSLKLVGPTLWKVDEHRQKTLAKENAPREFGTQGVQGCTMVPIPLREVVHY
ncbi:uncharacterized protein [Dermacentor andersoni]|uniref:uncharacterized protein n=1 Tax=Dermacentor andersoni TaxID=34620 RepID=UPI003B39FD6C